MKAASEKIAAFYLDYYPINLKLFADTFRGFAYTNQVVVYYTL